MLVSPRESVFGRFASEGGRAPYRPAEFCAWAREVRRDTSFSLPCLPVVATFAIRRRFLPDFARYSEEKHGQSRVQDVRTRTDRVLGVGDQWSLREDDDFETTKRREISRIPRFFAYAARTGATGLEPSPTAY
jgi:hypothetical protein